MAIMKQYSDGECGAELNLAQLKRAFTFAIEKHPVSVVESYLEKNVPAEGIIFGRTYLGYAAKKDDEELVRLLIRYGADPIQAMIGNLLDNGYYSSSALDDGNPCIDLSDLCYERSVQLLLDHAIGMDIGNPDEYIRYPKHLDHAIEKDIKIVDESAYCIASHSPSRLDLSSLELSSSDEKRHKPLLPYLYKYGAEDKEPHFDKKPLFFLDGLNCKGFNFVGISCLGQRITREFLQAQGLNLTNLEDAIVTYADLEKLKDVKRRNELKARLDEKFASQGKFIKDSIVNLVPLSTAISLGDINTVRMRLQAKVSPNYFLKWNIKTVASILEELKIFAAVLPLYLLVAEYAVREEWCVSLLDEEVFPIVLAAKKGHLEIVKLLLNHQALNPSIVPIAEAQARQGSHVDISNYLYLWQKEKRNQLAQKKAVEESSGNLCSCTCVIV